MCLSVRLVREDQYSVNFHLAVVLTNEATGGSTDDSPPNPASIEFFDRTVSRVRPSSLLTGALLPNTQRPGTSSQTCWHCAVQPVCPDKPSGTHSG